MPNFEYKVLPAPAAGLKKKGVSTPEGKFAHAIEIALNDMAAEGWEFQRAECLPTVERSGLTAKTTRNRHLLIFRRLVASNLQVTEPEELTNVKTTAHSRPQTPDDDASESAGARQMLRDNGVEELSEVAGLTSSLQALADARNRSKAKD